ncbi:hypothetical protein [Fusobacterium ulcerans]|nr:hypothetical protein [Fusobacterium ulcerans]
MKKEGVIFFNESLKRYDIGFLKETDGENNVKYPVWENMLVRI